MLRMGRENEVREEEVYVSAVYGPVDEIAFRDRSRIAMEEYREKERIEIKQDILDGIRSGPWQRHITVISEDEQQRLDNGPDWRGEEDIKSSAELKEALINVVKLLVLSGRLKKVY